ncbi:hypothetical protein F4777DRAFT_565501 [Nemania sp. FL0916]|nr:hypothetical protein F4777DRAFT_565501 [Nemania sp. FL0916]
MPPAPGTYWDLLERDTAPVKRRAAHAKTRTGCLTCKKRRVKCDEAKPHCARCVKAEVRCAGYSESVLPDPQPGRRTRGTATAGGSRTSEHPGRAAGQQPLLRPRPATVISRTAAAAAEGSLVDLMRASMTPAYLDIRDAWYFERFKCQVLSDLGSWCGSEYWRHTILREILVDKTVQHAALGAAAMLLDVEQQQYEYAQRKRSPVAADQSIAAPGMVVTEETNMLPATGDAGDAETPPVVHLSGANPHGRAALRHYTAAMQLCRESLAGSGLTLSTARPTLTATFFFAVFEFVQGNVGEADRLLANGVSLLDHALSGVQPDGSPSLVPDDELRQVQLAFDRMRVTWGLCPYFSADAKLAEAEEEEGMLGNSTARHFELPSPDASVRTKQVFWNAFSSDFGQFMVRMQAQGGAHTLLRSANLPAILAQRAYYLTQLQHWLPILEDLCAQTPNSIVLATTKVYAQTAIVFLNCFLDASELAYDAYLPVFRDVVATYERLLPVAQQKQQQGHLRLTLDVDLFHIITFTVGKCRDQSTRRRALRVFAALTRRQALWTNSAMLAALRALAELEDQGRRDNDADGFLPASTRYHYVNSEWDYQRHRMMAVFVPVLSRGINSDDDAAAVRIPIKF